MGRPLYSTLFAPKIEPAVRVADAEQTPIYERWSYSNPFDPDSDEDAVYEAFLTPEEIAQREEQAEAAATAETRPVTDEYEYDVVEIRPNSSSPFVVPQRPSTVYDEVLSDVEQRSLLLPPHPMSDESSTSESSGGSGRTSPLATDEPDLDSSLPPASNPFTWSDWVQGSPPDRTASPVIPDAQLISYGPPEVHSLPATPTRVWRPDTDFAVPPASAPVDIPIPDSPVPRAARAVSPPMTPPGSITPRFLTWGGNRARTAEIGSSPTPTGRYGSARSRMSVNYISPSLRVLQ